LTPAAYIVIASVIVGIVVWLLTKSRIQANYARQTAELQTSFSSQIAELDGKAKGLEAVNTELRQQIEQKDSETNRLRDELDIERQSKVEAVTRFEEAQKSFDEQRKLIEEIESKLSDKFGAISLNALTKNSTEFLKLAEEKFKSHTVEGKKELDSKKEVIDNTLKEMDKTLSDVRKRIEDVGKGNVEISTLIKKHEDVTLKLKDTTEHLKQALASSKKRGEWGERMAEDIIRLIGMIEGVNYIKQKTLESSSGRPDYTFLLPNNLKINMDVKFPLDNYIHYLNAESEHDKKRYRDELLKNTKVMIKQVTTREYINSANNTVDYVIIFVPNEQVYSFINESDATIMDQALKQKVILCSPFTLYAVLSVIRQAVENFNLERTASEILQLLGEFSKQWGLYKEKFETMGKRLEDAKKEYDTLNGTRSNMLERPLKKIEELRKQKAIAFDEVINHDKKDIELNSIN